MEEAQIGDKRKKMPSVDYKTHHLLPRLRESPEAAAGYIAACLTDNTESPESIALAFQDVAEAYELPIDVSIKANTEHERLQLAVAQAARVWNKSRLKSRDVSKDANEACDKFNALLNDCAALGEAVDALIAFEAEHGIGEK